MLYPTQRFVALTLIVGVVLIAMATRAYFTNGPAAAAAMSAQVHPTPSLSPNIPFIVPNANLIPNGGPILSDFDYFSWQSFIAMNWPAKIGTDGRPLRGVPDTTKTLGDPGPRVWETWKADYELFQNGKDGTATPSDWSDYEVKNAPCGQAQGHVLPLIAKGDSVIPGGVNQAMGGPLIPQQKVNNQLTYVRYEVRVNQTQYNETKNAQYYIRSKLPKFPARINFSSSKIDPTSGDGTYGAIEIKAAWRLMTPEEMNNQAVRSRYYITQATVVDPKTGQCSQTTVPVGLVGFHIGHKTSPFAAWVWSTFEQVDNVPCTRAEQQGDDTRCAAPPEGFSFNNGTNSPDATANGYFQLNALQPFNPNKPPPLRPPGDPLQRGARRHRHHEQPRQDTNGGTRHGLGVLQARWQSVADAERRSENGSAHSNRTQRSDYRLRRLPAWCRLTLPAGECCQRNDGDLLPESGGTAFAAVRHELYSLPLPSGPVRLQLGDGGRSLAHEPGYYKVPVKKSRRYDIAAVGIASVIYTDSLRS